MNWFTVIGVLWFAGRLSQEWRTFQILCPKKNRSLKNPGLFLTGLLLKVATQKSKKNSNSQKENATNQSKDSRKTKKKQFQQKNKHKIYNKNEPNKKNDKFQQNTKHNENTQKQQINKQTS